MAHVTTVCDKRAIFVAGEHLKTTVRDMNLYFSWKRRKEE